MREILFRGQTRKYGEKVRMGDGQKLPGHWVYGGVLQGVGSHSIIYGGENVNDPGENLDKWCVHTDTLGQYTGVKDRNGNPIFEGDIVVYDNTPYNAYGHRVTGVIVWHKWAWRCRYKEYESTYHYAIGTEDFFGAKSEVIGNIHDNPELLENP